MEEPRLAPPRRYLWVAELAYPGVWSNRVFRGFVPRRDMAHNKILKRAVHLLSGDLVTDITVNIFKSRLRLTRAEVRRARRVRFFHLRH